MEKKTRKAVYARGGEYLKISRLEFHSGPVQNISCLIPLFIGITDVMPVETEL